MAIGLIFCVAAGAAMSIQGAMNTRLGEHIGFTEANALVQCTAAILSLLALLVYRSGGSSTLGETNKLYMLGGILGLIITLTVMLGMKNLGTTVAVSAILIAQLLMATIIDYFGLLGAEKVDFSWTKVIGLGAMTAGLILFKK